MSVSKRDMYDIIVLRDKSRCAASKWSRRVAFNVVELALTDCCIASTAEFLGCVYQPESAFVKPKRTRVVTVFECSLGTVE